MDSDHNPVEIILCRYCDAKLKIRRTKKQLKVTCPQCMSVFFHNKPWLSQSNKTKIIWGGLIFAILVLLNVLNNGNRSNEVGNSQYSSANTTDKSRPAASRTISSNWIDISYGGLVDRSVLTHSGETVGEVIIKLPRFTDETKGLVQPYLEPFSILCHDAILTINGPDTLPFVNILDHYPIGSGQPAWVALFREGHYQLYYNPQMIRVFIKGSNVYSSFEKHRSVIRHAINDVSNSKNTAIERVDVYVFTNNYATTEIRLNTVPVTYSVDDFRHKTRPGSIDLGGIDEFLKEGIILEAVEVDDNNDLYFYGRESSKQTLAGSRVSLADIAVIYRSVFHFGNNSPYISLDKHEDNRFAKVNFGGHLENTHAGHVVLEADKLFKTLSTGLDPNTHRVIKKQILRNVPDFLSKAERLLMEDTRLGSMQIRYWFYPDSIGTVTNGSIGAVLTHQFLADVERMDMPISKQNSNRNTIDDLNQLLARKSTPARVGNAVRKTIEHLNNNFGQYERAFTTFGELSTVGRIMSLINWLKGMGMDTRIELDDLLSVNLPAFTTQIKTKKMLAITAIAYPKDSRISVQNAREHSKVYYISDLLDKYNPKTTDEELLAVAGNYFDKLSADDLYPPQYQEKKTQLEYYDQLIATDAHKLKALGEQITESERTLSSTSYGAIDRHNKLVDRFNSLNKTQKSYINKYKALLDEINSTKIVSGCITTVGGGINLRPKQFKRIHRSNSAPKIREISSLKNKIRSVGKISKSGNWIRNTVGKRGARVNTLPVSRWALSKSSNGSIKYDYTAGKNDRLTVKVSPDGGGWSSEVSVNGNSDVVKYSEGTRSLEISHPQLGVVGTGTINKERTAIEFTQ